MDWSPLCQGPCYPTAVYNTRHAGKCAAQLVLRLRELGIEDIHVIGFSLGAHVTNFIANNLKPYKLPRISGIFLLIFCIFNPYTPASDTLF